MTALPASRLHPDLSTPAPAWYCAAESADVDEHGRQAASWRLHYDQLGAGRFHGSLEEVRLPGLQVFRERLNQRVRQRGDLGSARFAFALVGRAGGDGAADAGPLALNGQRLPGADCALICNDAEVDLCTPADIEIVGIDADRALVLQVAADVCPDLQADAMRRFAEARIDPAATRRVGDLLMLAHQTARLAPWMLQAAASRQQLADTLLLELAEVLPAPDTWRFEPQALRRKRLVDRACDRMLAHPDQPPSLLEVCCEVGASRRKLTDCFQEALGVSPAHYLRVIRLNGVRRTLLAGEPGIAGVYDAAVRWGFWHFGEFSRAYRLQFGELPSQTLRRSRRIPITPGAPRS